MLGAHRRRQCVKPAVVQRGQVSGAFWEVCSGLIKLVMEVIFNVKTVASHSRKTYWPIKQCLFFRIKISCKQERNAVSWFKCYLLVHTYGCEIQIFTVTWRNTSHWFEIHISDKAKSCK